MKRGRYYWKVYHAARERFDLSDAQARAYWRTLRDWTEEHEGRRPYGTDVVRHPVVARKIARAVVMRAADVFERPAVPRRVPRERALTPPPLPKGTPLAVAKPEEWHVSITCKTGDRRAEVVDIGVSVMAPAGANAEQVRGAVWRALLGRELTAFKVAGVDWRKEVEDKTGRSHVTTREYGVADMVNFKSLAHAGKWRVALVEE